MKSEFCYCDWRQFFTATLATLFSLESRVMGSQVSFFDSMAGGT